MFRATLAQAALLPATPCLVIPCPAPPCPAPAIPGDPLPGDPPPGDLAAGGPVALDPFPEAGATCGCPTETGSGAGTACGRAVPGGRCAAEAAARGAGAAGARAVKAGDSAVAAANSSSAAVTSRCTSAWVPPASGTLAGMPALRTAALTSAITQHTSWIQASQTSTDSARRMPYTSSGRLRADSRGTLCGTGSPNTVTRAYGTPAVRATRAATATSPSSRSPGDRRRRVAVRYGRVGLIGGAISRVLRW